MNIEALRRKQVWLAHEAPEWARTLWPRPESFAWFLKSNKERLEAEGAIIKLGREWLLDADRFPAVALEILANGVR